MEHDTTDVNENIRYIRYAALHLLPVSRVPPATRCHTITDNSLVRWARDRAIGARYEMRAESSVAFNVDEQQTHYHSGHEPANYRDQNPG